MFAIVSCCKACMFCRVYKQIRNFESWVMYHSPGSNIKVLIEIYQVAASCNHRLHAIVPPVPERWTISRDIDRLWTSCQTDDHTGISFCKVCASFGQTTALSVSTPWLQCTRACPSSHGHQQQALHWTALKGWFLAGRSAVQSALLPGSSCFA